MGKTQFNQNLCGVLDIPQIEFNWEFCHAEFNNSLSFSLQLPGAIPGHLPVSSPSFSRRRKRRRAWNTPLVKKEIGKLAGVKMLHLLGIVLGLTS